MTSTNECQIGNTRIPNARINEDTLMHEGMRGGDFFTVLYTSDIEFFVIVDDENLTIERWPSDGYGYPAVLELDGKTVFPGDIIRAEHGRKFAIKGDYYQLDFAGVLRFVDC